MGLALYPSLQQEYLKLLADFAATGKHVALLSGDMHFAMKTDIKR